MRISTAQEELFQTIREVISDPWSYIGTDGIHWATTPATLLPAFGEMCYARYRRVAGRGCLMGPALLQLRCVDETASRMQQVPAPEAAAASSDETVTGLG